MVFIVVVLLCIALVLFLWKGEGYVPLNAAIPSTPCIPTTITPSPELTTSPDFTNVDDATSTAYKAAYAAYNTALDAYNKNATCVPTVCVNGTVDNTGNCICPEGTPYVHTDNKIYCVPVDLSFNLSVDKNLMFDPSQRKFVCQNGYEQTRLASGDITCYNTAGIKKVIDTTNLLRTATYNISKSPATVASAYGMIGKFYIAGQAVLPQTGLTVVPIPAAVPVRGAVVPGNVFTSTADCVARAPSGAVLFAYNPKTSSCTYYSNVVALSTLFAWTSASTEPCLTVGSTTLNL
jgi:hypothetical protein